MTYLAPPFGSYGVRVDLDVGSCWQRRECGECAPPKCADVRLLWGQELAPMNMATEAGSAHGCDAYARVTVVLRRAMLRVKVVLSVLCWRCSKSAPLVVAQRFSGAHRDLIELHRCLTATNVDE